LSATPSATPAAAMAVATEPLQTTEPAATPAGPAASMHAASVVPAAATDAKTAPLAVAAAHHTVASSVSSCYSSSGASDLDVEEAEDPKEKRAKYMRFSRAMNNKTRATSDMCSMFAGGNDTRTKLFKMYCDAGEDLDALTVTMQRTRRSSATATQLCGYKTRGELITMYNNDVAFVDKIVRQKTLRGECRPHPDAPDDRDHMQFWVVLRTEGEQQESVSASVVAEVRATPSEQMAGLLGSPDGILGSDNMDPRFGLSFLGGAGAFGAPHSSPAEAPATGAKGAGNDKPTPKPKPPPKPQAKAAVQLSAADAPGAAQVQQDNVSVTVKVWLQGLLKDLGEATQLQTKLSSTKTATTQAMNKDIEESIAKLRTIHTSLSELEASKADATEVNAWVSNASVIVRAYQDHAKMATSVLRSLDRKSPKPKKARTSKPASEAGA
jgi:hypothetical protein